MNTVSTGLVVFAGLLAAPLAPSADRSANVTPASEDPRLTRLQQFFGDNDCPAHRFAADFIRAADEHDLDWRLLPSISFIESGGGKSFRNNNILGWGNGNLRFSSIRAGIQAVAKRLSQSPLYRDKSVDQILRTFNPENAGYAGRVKAVMRQIARGDAAQLN